ncbi:HAMP domain-containing sensor histidine kinase [Terrabacter carboxydivorans]|uniref:histidine kinase n=1 Tax=Terrabacter carboxydivorans TaxID=619730 RepID=A0ABN3LBK7_9MICO
MTASSLLTRWRVRSLRFRILAVTAAAASVALVVALGAYEKTLEAVVGNTTTTAVTEQANQIASIIVAAKEPASTLRSVPARGSVLQLLGSDGRVLSYNDVAAANQPLADLHPAPGQVVSTRVDGIPTNEHEAYVVVGRGLGTGSEGAPVGTGTTLLVATPLQTESLLIEGATTALGVLALLLLAGLLWLINRVLSSALGRVERIRASVSEIGATRSPVRVPVPPGGDEITLLAQTMNEMLDRLQRADAAQRAFVSNASHELRSPLTAIRVISESSPHGIDAAGTAVVSGEALRMQRLVEDLLTLAKADDQGIVLQHKDVDLDDLLIEEIRHLRATSALTVTGDIHAARVSGDPDRLAQVVRNLVDNASRHARSSIRLECGPGPDASVVVTVDNDGDVVPADRREAIFDRFIRLQESRDRDTGGSGLGLSIVKALAEAHGGSVRTDVAPDGWCRFEVRLPAPA